MCHQDLDGWLAGRMREVDLVCGGCCVLLYNTACACERGERGQSERRERKDRPVTVRKKWRAIGIFVSCSSSQSAFSSSIDKAECADAPGRHALPSRRPQPPTRPIDTEHCHLLRGTHMSQMGVKTEGYIGGFCDRFLGRSMCTYLIRPLIANRQELATRVDLHL